MVRSAVALIALGGVVVACNMLSGADTLAPDEGSVPLPERKPDEVNGASDSGARGESSTSSSSGGRERGETPIDGGSSSGNPKPPTPASDAGFDASTATPGFSDLFARPDDPAIGNGWIEKQDKFSLVGGAVTLTTNGFYYDQFVARPKAEDSLDVQVSVDFTYNDDFDCDPTLLARIQPGSEVTKVLKGYSFYAFRDVAGFDREEGPKRVGLAESNIAPELEKGKTYRYVFRVTGTNPVKLDASISQLDGTTIVSMTTIDNAAEKVILPGQVGFGGGDALGAKWDNFNRTDL